MNIRKISKLNRKLLLIKVIFSLFLTNSFSQSFEQLKNYADDYYSKSDYYNASILYKQILKQNSKNLEILYNCANSLRLINNYSEAILYYEKVINLDTNNEFILAEFYIAEMCKHMGNYNKAINYFLSFLEKKPQIENYYINKAKQEINSCKWAIDHLNDSSLYKIEHLGKNVNTPYSEFGATQLGDSMLIYSSLGKFTENEFETFLPETYLSKIYYSWISVAGYSSKRELSGKINSKNIHTANISFDNKMLQAFFTRCVYNQKNELVCNIYSSNFKNGKWDKPQKMNNLINYQNYTSTHPYFVSYNGKDILYFVSNRPGGFGQLDIWYSIKYNGEFQLPVNLGSTINSPGNEITPFYNISDSSLYFSSDWHYGFGGYDIFSSKGELNNWQKPNNILKPINSFYNDNYITFNNNNNKEGYFTSNRPTNNLTNSETCCYDIFKFEIDKKNNKINTTNLNIKNQDTIKKLLPITLYFHNDEPDPASMKSSTYKNYKQTLTDYISLRDKYLKEYSKGLRGVEKQKAIDEINFFFNNNVERGFELLELLAKLLLEDLQKNNNVKITVKGFASPLNTESYNINLSKRRISSLINYLKEYNNGIMEKYFIGDSINSPLLTIFEEPLGKSKASKDVSSDPKDPRNSIYSPAAALERKIQILYYEYDQKEKLNLDTIPKLLFLTDSIVNYGKINSKNSNAFTINIQNVGKKSFSIKNITSDCNCLRFYWDEKELLPEEKMKLHLLILTENQTGIVKTNIILTTNQSEKKFSIPIIFEVIK